MRYVTIILSYRTKGGRITLNHLTTWRNRRHQTQSEFFSIIDDLLRHSLVQQLDNCPQHFRFTRLRHSMDVAYLSFVIAKLLRLNSRSVARAGVLHDLFFHAEGQNSTSLLFSHPRIALENARQVCTLSPLEEDIILKHMFLLTPAPPKSVEGFVVTLVDKYCALREFVTSPFVADSRCSAQWAPKVQPIPVLSRPVV